ncbi:hypothetical protein AMTR_s00136p00107420 [Amborella trichopoda]|uniref:Uncharacterized protein n=1 Tax=Amborella trichopoda TaxID=13333 RepID=W1NFP6_AMBTC|nr:hypothetical protein AMTR_s00136p00107420 [Amborella trichopoda]
MPINLDNVFQKDRNDEWVLQRTVVLDQDFLRVAVANMDANNNVVAPNKKDMVEDMGIDNEEYADDKDEYQDDKQIYRAMKNDWQEPVVEGCEGAQHDTMLDVKDEDAVQLVREEVQTSKHSSYSIRERRNRTRHHN